MPSVVINILLAVSAVAAGLCHAKRAPLRVVLRYFTVLSNLLCAVASLAVAVCRLAGSMPYAVLLLKYIGTAAVTVTLLTVLLFLGPTIGYKMLFSGPDLWLHLICPVLAIVSFLLWDKPEMPFGAVALGILPVLLYGAVYLYRVLLAPEEKRWKDFYGFNRGGKIRVSYALMTVGTLLVSVALWLL